MFDFKDTARLAASLLREWGFTNITFTGETSKHMHKGRSETWLQYTAEPKFDWPVVVVTQEGSVRLEPWTYGHGGPGLSA